ncbi:GNAT family N-acetyltransferase [Halomarina litorea]|uniref:GNAT family N-acetyltransferase n=1 Tax=Halomarina litorea TaxID=2961595 RepID=UPI0020C555D3|nr:GNAT family N-acetyltransferase [Halomarina sp. BCD28]
MTDAFALRLATADDAAAVRRIYAPFVADTAITFEQDDPSRDEIRGRIEETLPASPWLVCERSGESDEADESDELGGEVVGYAYAGPVRKRAAYQWSVESSVYVDPAAQRRGVARALYTALIALLADQGYRNIFAVMTLPNEASAAFHEALGFESVGVLADAGYKLGDWHDVAWLQKRIGSEGDAAADAPAPPRSLDDLPPEALAAALRAGEAHLGTA